MPSTDVGPSPVLQIEAAPEFDLIVLLTKDGLSAYSLSQRRRILDPLPKTKGAHGFTIDRRKQPAPSKVPSSPPGVRLQVLVFLKRKVQVAGLVLQLTDPPASSAPPHHPTCTSCVGSGVMAEGPLRNTPHHILPLRAVNGRLWFVHLKASYRLVKLESTLFWNAGKTESLALDEGITIDLPSGAEPVSCVHHEQLVLAVGPTLHFIATPTTHEETPTQQAALQLRSKPRALASAGTFVLAACDGAVEVILANKTFGVSRVQELFYPNVASICLTQRPLPLRIALFAPANPQHAMAGSLVRPSFSGFYGGGGGARPDVIPGGIEILRCRPAEAITRDLESVGDYPSAMDMVPLLVEEPAERTALLQGIRARYALHLLSKGSLPEALLYLSSAFPEDPFPLLGLMGRFTGLARDELEAAAAQYKGAAPLQAVTSGSLDPHGPDRSLALALCLPYLYSYRSRILFRSEDDPSRDALSTLLDTALVHVLVEAADYEGCFQLVAQENKADFARCAAMLQSKGLFAELVELYRQRGQHEQALALLRKICRSDDSLEVPLDGRSLEMVGKSGARKLAEYLKTLGSGEPSTPGPVIGEVERLHLVLEYSETVAALDPQAALHLFIEIEPPLPPRRVIDHLRRCRPSLCVPFLEAIMEQMGPFAHTEFDQELAMLLLEGAKSEGAEAQAQRDKLQALLLSSLQLKLELLVPALAAVKGLEEEHAIALIRCGRSAEAFALLARGGIEDGVRKAERWCAFFAAPRARFLTPTDGSKLWTVLLEVLLRPDAAPVKAALPSPSTLAPRKDRLGDDSAVSATSPSPAASAGVVLQDEVMALLHRYGHLMDSQAALSLLPDALAFPQVLPFLERLLPSLGEQRRALAARKALLRIEELRLRAEIAEREKGRVVISWDRACAVCFKRIGLSAFTVSPGGELAHLHCGPGHGIGNGQLSRTQSQVQQSQTQSPATAAVVQ